MGRKRCAVRLAAAMSAAVAVGQAAVATGADAQAWPSRQITIVVPFAAGGGVDTFTRPLAALLDKQIDQRFIIENRAGAGGTAGAAVAAKAAPDGYTLFAGATHHTIAPSIYAKLPYDIEKDFVPLAVLAHPPHVVVVNPQKVAARTLKDLIAEAKANPGKMNFASAGNGTTHHLAGELFNMITGTKITHVPYRGAGPAMQDLIAGHVNVMFDGLGTSAGPISGGQILGLAVTAAKRSATVPNIPTAAEAGLPGFEFSTWYAIWALKGTPEPIVKRLKDEIAKALKEPSIAAAWARNGTEVPSIFGDDMAKLVAQDIAKWGKVVKEAGIKMEGG